MATDPTPSPMETPPTAADLERDRKLEVLLDEMVASSPALPPDFAARVSVARPFAPWEVRRAWAWKAPALAAGGLLAASLAVFLAPLAQLAPSTAVSLWGHLVSAALSSSVPAALAAGPALVEAADSLRATLSPGAGLGILAAGAATGLATLGVLRRRAVRVRR